MSLQPNEVVTILYGEYERVQGKAAATDSAFMSYLSIGVTPFLAFTAYAVTERKFQVFLAALPILSVLGMMVVAVLSTHYVYTGAYLEYLERRINRYIGIDELRDLDFTEKAYKVKTSPVIISYAIALAVLLGMNVAAAPAIDLFLRRFVATHHLPCLYRDILAGYWYIVVPFVLAAGGLLVYSFVSTSLNMETIKRNAIEKLSADDAK